MRNIAVILAVFISCFTFSQDEDKAELKAQQASNNSVYKGNALLESDNFVEAEMEYRKAISKAPNKAVGAYNLSHSYYKKGNYNEAVFRGQEAAKNAKSKEEKHLAFHNLGNFLMNKKDCKAAVEAYKNALRSNPSDEETRYNLALAKECAEDQEKDGGGEDNKEDKDKNKEEDKKDQQKKDDQNDDNKDNKDKGDEDKKDGEDEEDEKGKPKDDQKDKGKDDKDKNNKNNKPKPGQMSPQQMKNILEAMQNQEQKVQEKINAEKQKGAKVKTEKDW